VREPVEAIIQDPSGDWLEFADPVRVVIAESPHAVRPALTEVERLTRDLGLHAVGFVSYEAGLAFDLATRPQDMASPLAWRRLFEAKNVRAISPPAAQGSYQVGSLRRTIDRETFERAFFVIKEPLAAGSLRLATAAGGTSCTNRPSSAPRT
jgi:para-aminobenzoate synthetase/4-amino-4-deoxychorismate lyase